MQKTLTPKLKLWLEEEGTSILGERRIKMLEAIEREGSLSKAAERMEMSYRHLWGTVKELEKRLEFKIVKTVRGGKGGGGTTLTKKAKKLIEKYNWMNDTLNKAIKEKAFWKSMSTKLSARNHLDGKIEDVELGPIGAKIKIKIEPGTVTSFITREAAEDLDLKEEDNVEAVIKATEVMISKSEG